MGAKHSDLLGDEEIEDLSSISNFTHKEIKKLYKRFKRLDSSDSGTISANDLYAIPEFTMNPVASRIFTLFNEGEDQINFKQFITTLSAFSPKGEKNLKFKCAFKVYDVDNDGSISIADLSQVLSMMVGKNLPPEQLRIIVEKIIEDADIDGDGKLSFDEFCKTVDTPHFEETLTINLFSNT